MKSYKYYLRNGRGCDVLLWNVWNQVDAARALIADPGRITRKHLEDRLK
jgi:3-phenylpropionate/trans-cinnamate dioxygenase ferredoxin reductase subunit